MYSFTVTITGIENSFSAEALNEVGCGPTGVFSPKEFSTGLEEAKELCAGYIISCLDILSQKNSTSCRTNEYCPIMSPSQNESVSNSQNLDINNILSSLDITDYSKKSNTNPKNKNSSISSDKEKIAKPFSFQNKNFSKEGLTKN